MPKAVISHQRGGRAKGRADHAVGRIVGVGCAAIAQQVAVGVVDVAAVGDPVAGVVAQVQRAVAQAVAGGVQGIRDRRRGRIGRGLQPNLRGAMKYIFGRG